MNPPAIALDIDRLVDAKARLAAGEALMAPDRALLVAALDAAARADRRSARAHGLRRRNDLLRQLASRHLADLPSRRAKAHRLARISRRYVACSWPRDRGRLQCPDHLAGRPEALLWHALKAWPRLPESGRQMEEILR